MATIVYIFPNFENCARSEKDLKDNKDNSLHLGQKYARIFVFGHYLFLVAHSFPRASLSENCSLLGTDIVRGQISERIFAPNGDYCLYIPQFSKPRVLRKCLEIVNTIASMWRENMLGYLSLDITCSSKLTVFLELRSRKTVRFSEQILSRRQISERIFAPNSDYCLYIP